MPQHLFFPMIQMVKILEGYQKKVEDAFRLQAVIEAHGMVCALEAEDLKTENIEETLKTLNNWIGNYVEHEPDQTDGQTG